MTTTTVLYRKTQATLQFPHETSEASEVLPTPYDVESEETHTEFFAEEATEHFSRSLKEVSPYVPGMIETSVPRRFDPLQQWEGVVEGIDDGTVTATLIDLTDKSRAMEIVTLPRQEFPEADWPVLVPDAIFYWSIGYEYVTGGTKRRVSEIRVRRTPEWSESAIESVKRDGLELYKRFGGCVQDDSSEEG